MHYELLNVRKWPFNVVILASLRPENFDKDVDGDDGLGLIDYAAKLTLSRRGKNHLYEEGMKEQEVCVQVAVGEINPGTGEFDAWPVERNGVYEPMQQVMVSANTDMFHPTRWPKPGETTTEDVLEDVERLPPTARLKYTFDVVDDCHAYLWVGKGKDAEPEWVKMANFSFVRYLNVYQFMDGSHIPFYKFLVRCLVDSQGEGTVYVHIDDVKRSPSLDGAKYLDVEIVTTHARVLTQRDVRNLFSEHHSRLDAAHMTPDHMACLMLSMEMPLPDAVISRFGRQSSGMFVAGNIAFQGGRIFSHAEAKVAIMPNYFDEAIMPIPRSDFPRHIIIPFPHVRYTIGLGAWTNLLPRFFRCAPDDDEDE